jgi:hypothetical protein
MNFFLLGVCLAGIGHDQITQRYLATESKALYEEALVSGEEIVSIAQPSKVGSEMDGPALRPVPRISSRSRQHFTVYLRVQQSSRYWKGSRWSDL